MGGSGDQTVIVFTTCVVDVARPVTGAATVRLLRRLGYVPTVARGATCCGQPAYNGGFVADATRVAARTVRALARYGPHAPIVVPSGSCTTMLARHAPGLLAGTRLAGAAESVAGRVVELSGFLARHVEMCGWPRSRGQSGLGGQSGLSTAAVTYHDSCHMLRELSDQVSPRTALSAAGVTVREMPGRDRCCGFGGTFSVKLAAVSTAMADEKLDEAMATGATVVIGCDQSCLVHLDGRARRRELPLEVRHLAEILDAATSHVPASGEAVR